MSKIISVHSYRGGTGKSNLVANISVLLAMNGNRVGAIDTDIQSPGLHVLFNMDPGQMKHSLNDYLWNNCEITDTAYDVTPNLETAVDGKVFIIPSSADAGSITRILRSGYDVSLLNDGYDELIEELELDVLLIDTHPGLNEETLLSIAISDRVIIILRPDYQDYQGTSVAIEVAKKLGCTDGIMTIVNKTPTSLDSEEIKQKIEETLECDIATMLHQSEEMMVLASQGIFVLHYPEHVITQKLKQITTILME